MAIFVLIAILFGVFEMPKFKVGDRVMETRDSRLRLRISETEFHQDKMVCISKGMRGTVHAINNHFYRIHWDTLGLILNWISENSLVKCDSPKEDLASIWEELEKLNEKAKP